MVDTDHLRRMGPASAFGIPDKFERNKIIDAADEIDALRSAVRVMLGPDTYDVVQRRAQSRLLGSRELLAIRRAFSDDSKWEGLL